MRSCLRTWRSVGLLALLVLAGCGAVEGPASTTPSVTAQSQQRASATGEGVPAPTQPAPPLDMSPAPAISTPLPIARAPELPVLYRVMAMDQVAVKQDVAYATERSPAHLLDIYHPPGHRDITALQPAVLLVHGSLPASARAKDQAPFTSWARLLAASGMAAVTFNWEHPQQGDLDAALAYVRENGASMGVDPQRLAVLAFSGAGAGATTLAMGNQGRELRALVVYYGDLREPARQLTTDVAGALPPTLIVVAGQDEYVPAGAAEGYADAARKLGASVEVLTHPTGAHAFDLRNDDQPTRDIIRRTLEFLKSSLE